MPLTLQNPLGTFKLKLKLEAGEHSRPGSGDVNPRG